MIYSILLSENNHKFIQMKNCALLCFALVVSFTTLSQQPTLNILGLAEGHTISNIELLSVTSQDVSTYIIEKTNDNHSSLISSSIVNNTMHESVFLRKTLRNGYISTTKLTGVTLSDLQSFTQNGEQVERFLLHFQLEESMH